MDAFDQVQMNGVGQCVLSFPAQFFDEESMGAVDLYGVDLGQLQQVQVSEGVVVGDQNEIPMDPMLFRDPLPTPPDSQETTPEILQGPILRSVGNSQQFVSSQNCAPPQVLQNPQQLVQHRSFDIPEEIADAQQQGNIQVPIHATRQFPANQQAVICDTRQSVPPPQYPTPTHYRPQTRNHTLRIPSPRLMNLPPGMQAIIPPALRIPWIERLLSHGYRLPECYTCCGCQRNFKFAGYHCGFCAHFNCVKCPLPVNFGPAQQVAAWEIRQVRGGVWTIVPTSSVAEAPAGSTLNFEGGYTVHVPAKPAPKAPKIKVPKKRGRPKGSKNKFPKGSGLAKGKGKKAAANKKAGDEGKQGQGAKGSN